MTQFGNGRGPSQRQPRRGGRNQAGATRRDGDGKDERAAPGKDPKGPEHPRAASEPVPRRAGAPGRVAEGALVRRSAVPRRAKAQDPLTDGGGPSATGGPRPAAARGAPARSPAAERVLAKRAARKAAATAEKARKAPPAGQPVTRRSEGRLVKPRSQAQDRPEVDGAPVDRRRRASAGRIIIVGFLCFLIWLLFDANQLYHSAEAGQIGARRTVAVIILRPIAALSNALHISGPVNSADSALGRCGIGGAPACASTVTLPTIPVTVTTVPTPPPTTFPSPPPTGHRALLGYMGLLAAPHISAGLWYPGTVPSWPPPIASPTPGHPLTLLSIGDSIGEDLGFGLGDVFSMDPVVQGRASGSREHGSGEDRLLQLARDSRGRPAGSTTPRSSSSCWVRTTCQSFCGRQRPLHVSFS